MDLTTPNSKTNALLQEHGLQPSEFPVNLRKQLVYVDARSFEIAVANANSNRNVVSGKILKKYKLLKYAAKELAPTEPTIQGSEQICKFRAEERKAHPAKDDVVSFYLRDDVSTSLPGKRDAKKIAERKRIQKRTLNYYLSNMHTKVFAEFPQHEISLSTFARLRPSYCMLTSFTNRHSCLCTKHQNVPLKLRILMLSFA